ncbi:MAG: GspMb/PilO family protein [Prosthecobacter sp.]
MNSRERRLIFLLMTLAALCAGAIATQSLLKKQRMLARREDSLTLKKQESAAMLAEAGLWKSRLQWLQAHQPPVSSDNQASQALLDELLASASQNDLTVQKKQLHETIQTGFYREIGVTLTLAGDVPDVFRWLHGLLSPESFRMVSLLKIIPDPQAPSKVSVTSRISRRHAPLISAAAEAPTEGGGS